MQYGQFILNQSQELTNYRISDPKFSNDKLIEEDKKNAMEASAHANAFYFTGMSMIKKNPRIFLESNLTNLDELKRLLFNLVEGVLLDDELRSDLIAAFSKNKDVKKKGIILGDTEEALEQMKSKGIHVREGAENLKDILKQFGSVSTERNNLLNAVDSFLNTTANISSLLHVSPKGNLPNSKIKMLNQLGVELSKIELSGEGEINVDPLQNGKVALKIKEEDKQDVQVDLSSLTETLNEMKGTLEQGLKPLEGIATNIEQITGLSEKVDRLGEIAADKTSNDSEVNEVGVLKEHNEHMRHMNMSLQQTVQTLRGRLEFFERSSNYDNRGAVNVISLTEIQAKIEEDKLQALDINVLRGKVMVALGQANSFNVSAFNVLLSNYLDYPQLFVQKLYEILKFDKSKFIPVIESLINLDYLKKEKYIVIEAFLLSNVEQPFEHGVARYDQFARVMQTMYTESYELTFTNITPKVFQLDDDSMIRVLGMNLIPSQKYNTNDDYMIILNELEGRELVDYNFLRTIDGVVRHSKDLFYVISHLHMYMHNEHIGHDTSEMIVSDELNLCRTLAPRITKEAIDKIYSIVRKKVSTDKSDILDSFANFGNGRINQITAEGSSMRVSVPIMYSANNVDTELTDLTAKFPVYTISTAFTRDGFASAYNTSIVQQEGERKEGVSSQSDGYSIDMVYTDGAIGIGFTRKSNIRVYAEGGR